MPSISDRRNAALATALLAVTLIAAPAPAIALVSYEPPAVADQPAAIDESAAADEPTVVTDEPAALADEPTVVADEPPVVADEPTVVTEPASPLSSAAVVDGVGFTVDHAWIDPLVLNDLGRPFFSVELVFPPIAAGVHAVAHGQAPSGLSQSSHCRITPFSPTMGIAGLTCELRGTLTPGTTTTALSVRSEAGDDYGSTLSVTLCPLTGCSGEFEVAVAPTELELCAGDDLAELGAIAYDFNVPWNASGAALGAGAPAGTGFDPGSVRDGGTFRLTGVVGQPGIVPIPLVVTDEFGGTHTAVASVTVLDQSSRSCGMLAATGTAEQSVPALALLSLCLVLAGTLATRRPQRGLVSRRRW